MEDVHVSADQRKGHTALVTNDEWVILCEVRHTVEDEPDNGWVTIMPILGYEVAATTAMLECLKKIKGELPPVYSLSPEIQLRQDIRQVALLKDETIKLLPKEVGEMMKRAQWMDDKGKAIEVDIHHE